MILSIAITVYIVVTQRIELRKKAEEVPYKTSFSSRTITDNCSGGPFVEIQATGTSYDAKTGVQTLNLIARRRGGTTVPTPTTSRVANPTVTRAPTAITAPTATRSPTSTTVPLSTATTTGGAVQGVAEGDIEIYLSEVGCANPVGAPDPNSNQCNSCSAADPVYFNRGEAKYIIPAGVNQIPISISITKPVTQLTCGCTQMDVHINRIVYAGNLNQTPAQQRADCSTLGSAVNNKPRQYLYAVGWNGNCAGLPTASPTTALTATPTEGIPPTFTPIPPTLRPTTTPQSTPTANQHPVCTGLSASPTSGTAPLTVHFVGSGTDPDGPIQKFDFTYGDGKTQQIEKDVGITGSVEVDHTYTVSGSFVATLRIQDNNGVWSDPTDNCSVTITTSGGLTVTPSPTTTQRGGVAPTATRTPTPTASEAASASATPVVPEVPVSGGIIPTLAVGLSGLLIIGLGLLLVL